MRVGFFLLDGETNASSRHRVLQYFSLLREHGIQPVACRPVPEAIYQRLVEDGRHTTGAKAAFYSLFLAKRAVDVIRADRFDLAVIQRDLFPFGPPWLERLLATRNPKLVYDTDDATYVRPAFTPDTPFQRLRHFDKVVDLVRRARWVSAATEPIAVWAQRYNPNVSVVPMAVDLHEYDRARRAAAATTVRGPTVIGWAGTAGGLRYLHALAPVLRDLAARHDIVVRVVSGGYRRVCLPGVPVDARPWRPATGLIDMARFDIGLVPLDDSPFEQAKFPFKLLQYLALGVPSVSARVGVAASLIRDADNGLLASSADEWRARMEALIVDPSLRQRLALAGRATVAARYSLERVGPLLMDGLIRAAA
ncbi:MAG: glycosyltransferase [Chloroflexi bacterium]|nr:glycosyltransferase [Chloroflexota bacterium]MBV9602404.1 glycosyltransferase [Chloroflexota bacterium]